MTSKLENIGVQPNRPLHFEIESSPSWSSWLAKSTINKNVVLTSKNHSVLHHSRESFLLFPQAQDTDGEQPDFDHLQTLLGALILSTALACFSAFDAKNVCRSMEAYDVYDQILDDDVVRNDVGREREQDVCLVMFINVIVPICVIVFVCAPTGLLVMYFHRKHILHEQDRLEKHKKHLRICFILAGSFIPILLVWVYGGIAIMLRPRSREFRNNPYRSLAAVDKMGHVGANANLYYTTWISFGLSTSLVYQITVDTVRQWRRYRRVQSESRTSDGGVEAMLSSLTTSQLEQYRESRAMWYQSFYRLRARTGIWTAALLGSLIIMLSSIHIYQEVLNPAAMTVDPSHKIRSVCKTLRNSSLPPELCTRTSISFVSGMVASILCFGAILMHLAARRGAAKVIDTKQSLLPNHLFGGAHIPLRSEFVGSILLSFVLGINAVFATAVPGPAASVGNLYYSSWMSFVLCIRVCLGCLEELCRLEEAEEEEKRKSAVAAARLAASSYKAPSTDYQIEPASMISTIRSHSSFTHDDNFSSTDLSESDRAQKTRNYAILGISSTVCSAAALDAAENQNADLDFSQRYTILTPAIVAIVCGCQFLLCLHPTSYYFISRFWVGGIFSFLMFGVCVSALVMTMHSEHSWAVDAVGNIEMANLYYFVWASTLTAGIQMMSYLKGCLGSQARANGEETVAWAAVVKICFVILGAGYHIWYNISGTCTLDEIKRGSVTYCSRTVFAIAVAFTGMIMAGVMTMLRILAALWRMPISVRVRSHLELIISLFLVLLFGVSVALITAIGGPGQSVGDMYYATWLAFLVGISLVRTCYNQMRREEGDTDDDSGGDDDEDGVEYSGNIPL